MTFKRFTWFLEVRYFLFVLILSIFYWFFPLSRPWNYFQLWKILIINFNINLYATIFCKVLYLNSRLWWIFIKTLYLLVTLYVWLIILREEVMIFGNKLLLLKYFLHFKTSELYFKCLMDLFLSLVCDRSTKSILLNKNISFDDIFLFSYWSKIAY